MYSIKFPDMFGNINTNIVTDYDATLSNLKLLLLSDKGTLFGDPYYGCNLKKLLFEQNNIVIKDLIIDDICTSIKIFLPQLKVNRNDVTIKSSLGVVHIGIKALNLLNQTINLYEINLTNTQEI
jgi:phage baseplate assembly protein W